MSRRAIRKERRAQEEAKWQGFAPDWRDDRDKDDDDPPPANTFHISRH